MIEPSFARGEMSFSFQEFLHRRAEGSLGLYEALKICEQILIALEHAHNQGVIHRHIEPADIMIRNGAVEILRSEITAADANLPAVLFGSPAYMSPEQLCSLEIDHRSDLYSAALIVFEAIAGRPPFQAEADRALIQCHLSAMPPELGSLVPEVPAGVSAAVAIALRKKPEERFQTARDFLRALQEGFAGFLPVDPSKVFPQNDVESSETPPPVEPLPPLPRRGSSARLVATAWVLLGLNLLAAYGLWHSRHPKLPSPAPSRSREKTPAPNPVVPSDVIASPLDEERSVPSTIVPDEGSTPLEPPPKEAVVIPVPKPIPAPSTTPGESDSDEIRRKELDRVKEEVRQSIQHVSLDLEGQSFDTAQKDLDELMGRAQRYPDEMQEEIHQIKELREHLIEARVAARTREQEIAFERAAWERRLQQIQSLMQKERYPEAISQADDLSNEQGVPVTVAARARELSTQATQELKKVWSDTQMGPTKNEIRKKPPKHGERRL